MSRSNAWNLGLLWICACAWTGVAGCGASEDPAGPVALRQRVHLLNLPPSQLHLGTEARVEPHDSEAGLRVHPFALQDDFRQSLFLEGGDWLEFRSLPDGPGSLSFGVSFADGAATAGTVARLRLSRIASGGASELLWSEDFRPAQAVQDRAWRDISIELPAGCASGLRFELLREPAQERPRLVLGSPVLEVENPGFERPDVPPRCVVLFLIDTLRADHLGLYGYSAPTSPRIDALGSESIVFADVSSASSWTKASVASLLTGRYPSLIRVEGYKDQLPSAELTVADTLRDAGYKTAAFGFNKWIFDPKFGFASRFDEFHEVVDRTTPRETRSSAVVDEAIDWLDRNCKEPFFLYVHTLDPHAPYLPLPADRARFADPDYEGPVDEWVALARSIGRDPLRRGDLSEADLAHARDLYDAEIFFNDSQVGLLVDRLKTLGLWEECLFILTADHGEEFLEHGSWSHGGPLFEEQLRVPLVIKPPASSGLRPEVVDTPVSLVDVVPTILQIQRIDAAGMELVGQSLAELLHRPEGWSRPFVLAELDYAGSELVSLREGRWKFIQRLLPVEREMLFDLDEDPGEQVDRIASAPAEVLERFRQLVRAHRSLERSEGVYIEVLGTGEPLTLTALVSSEAALPAIRFLEGERSDRLEFRPGRAGESTQGLWELTAELEGEDRSDIFLLQPSSASAPITIRLLVDNAKVPAESVLLGPSRTPLAEGAPLVVRLDDAALQVTERLDTTNVTRPKILIYVVPSAELTLTESDVEALRALGYFGDGEGE